MTAVETRLRARARTASGGGRQGGRRGLDRPALRRVLGDTLLVVFFELDGRLGAVVVDGGSARLMADLGVERADVDRLIGASLFALRRLAHPDSA